VKNITVSVPDEIYRRARVWAAERGTSVSAVVTRMLETLPVSKRAARHLGVPHNDLRAHPPANDLTVETQKPVG